MLGVHARTSMITPPPEWDDKRIVRALDLMERAGWIARRDHDAMFTGMQMTTHGQKHAETFLAIFRELECRSLEDFQNVLGVVSWYLNKDETN